MTTVTLPPICDRAAARALYPELRDAVGSRRLTIEGGEVERVGQAMLQLLVSAAASEAGIALRQPSEKLEAALSMAGLDSVLAPDIEAGADQ